MNKTIVSAALAAVALAPVCAFAEGPCGGPALTGVVRDPSAALIPGATVTLDETRTQQSSSDGHFTFDCVAPGAHRLTAHADGFADMNTPLRLPRTGALELTLTPAMATSIDVDAEGSDAPASTTSAGPTQTISGKQLQQLADDPDDLLRELQQMAAAAGGNPANATIAVDGFQDSSRLPPKDSIAYIKVNPDLFSAEYREPPFGNGGRVEIYTKPGQKAYHGALFTTNGSAWENARDPFSTSKAALGKQRYGFEFGGPIRKTGSDFFTSLEYRRIDDFAVVHAQSLDAGGNLVNVNANVATPQRLWQPTARMDWQLNAKNTFIASYSGSVSSQQNQGVGGLTLAESGFNSTSYDHTLRMTDVTTLSSHLMHEARASIRFFGATDTPLSNAPQIQVTGYFNGGGASVGNLTYRRMRLEVDDDFILTTSHHTLKGGTQFFFNDDHRTLTNNFNGAYTYTSLAQYRSNTPYSFTNVSGDPRVNFMQFNNALFLQDDWKLSHGVSISGGLRYYIQSQPLMANGITPRFSVQWAPGKDPQWTLHAHAGMFSGAISTNEYAEILREDGVHRITNLVYNPTYGAPVANGATMVQTERTIAKPFSNMSYAMYNVGGTRNLPAGFVLSVDLGWGRFWNYIRSNNINAPLDGSANGPRPFGANLNILQVQNSGQGRLDFEFFGIQNFKYKRVNFFAGAVHIDQIDNTNDDTFFTPQNARSEAGEFARRADQPSWQVFSNFTFNLPAKLQLSGDFNANGNQPFNITTGADDNHDGVFNDRPQVAAAGTPGAVQTRYGLLVESGGVAVLGRDRGLMPWRYYLDGNLQRSFKLTRDSKAEHQQTLTVNVRSSNLLNHTNVTGVQGVFSAASFGQAYAADNGRRVEAGLRYSF